MRQNSSIIRLSTEDFPERDRVAIFREQFGRSQFGLDIEPLPDVPFRLTSTMRPLPGAVITSNAGSGVRVWRTREFLADGRDDLIMIVNLPRAAIGPLMPNADDAVLRPIAPDCTALRLLIRYAGAVLDIDAPLQGELQRCIVDHIYDLVAAAIGGTRDAIAVAKGRGIPAARLSAIKGDIRENLVSRDLSIETICARHGISSRYVRLLFAGEQTTFSDFVLDRRLALARRRLRDPARLGLPISAIAYECGFGDLSYFNRVFRRHFAMTPSDVRAEACDALRGPQRAD